MDEIRRNELREKYARQFYRQSYMDCCSKQRDAIDSLVEKEMKGGEADGGKDRA